MIPYLRKAVSGGKTYIHLYVLNGDNMLKSVLKRTLVFILTISLVFAAIPQIAFAATLSTSVEDLTASYDNGTWTASENAPTYYTVTWMNGDEVLLKEQVMGGTVPVYTGNTPEMVPDDGKTYIFSGWSPEVGVITEDTVYTAVYRIYSAPKWKWSSDYTYAEAFFKCEANGDDVTVIASVTLSVTTPATCYTAGEMLCTASAVAPFNGNTYQHSESVSIPALGHDWCEWTVSEAATCTEDGEETRSCSRCDATETRVAKATGHVSGEPVHEKVIAPGYWTEGSCDEVVYCTACHKELSRTHVTLPGMQGAVDNGSSLSLRDRIGINIYVEIPDDAEGWTAKIYYEKDGFTEAVSTYNLDKTSKNGYSSKNDEYKFVYSNISAREMTDKVRVKIFDADGNQVKILAKDGSFVDFIDYCAADWANTMINDPTRPAATVNLAKALLNYGGEAQKYFDYKPELNANAAGYFAAEMAAVTAGDLEAFAPVKDSNASAVGSNGISLSLKSEIYLNVYFMKEVTVSAANLNGAKIAVSMSGNKWVAKITGINARNLGNQYTLTIKNGRTTSIQTYCALSWAYSILSGSSESAKPLAKALYLYQQAAVEYFK